MKYANDRDGEGGWVWLDVKPKLWDGRADGAERTVRSKSRT